MPRAGDRRAAAVLLADRPAVVVPRQRPDLLDVRHSRGGWQPGGLAAGEQTRRAGGDQLRGGVHGGDDLHRQRAELHGQSDRRRERLPDAVVPRLPGLLDTGAGAGVGDGDGTVFLGMGRGAPPRGSPRPIL